MVHNGLAGEPDTGLVTFVIEDAVRALNFYADPAWAPKGWASLAATARAAVHAVKPGSSLQLAWARTFATAARTEDDLAVISRWLGGTPPAGLVVDVDLRWLLLRALVAMGVADEDEIERMAGTDRSVTGLRQAVLARAFLPSVEAKQRAWQAAVS